MLQSPCESVFRSLVNDDDAGGKGTYGKHHSAVFLCFFKFCFFFIAPNALDVISPIRMVGFVVGDVELSHDGQVKAVNGNND